MNTLIANFMNNFHVGNASCLVCVASVSAREMKRERPKPRIPFLGLSLLRNQTETLATQAINFQRTHLSRSLEQAKERRTTTRALIASSFLIFSASKRNWHLVSTSKSVLVLVIVQSVIPAALPRALCSLTKKGLALPLTRLLSPPEWAFFKTVFSRTLLGTETSPAGTLENSWWGCTARFFN